MKVVDNLHGRPNDQLLLAVHLLGLTNDVQLFSVVQEYLSAVLANDIHFENRRLLHLLALLLLHQNLDEDLLGLTFEESVVLASEFRAGRQMLDLEEFHVRIGFVPLRIGLDTPMLVLTCFHVVRVLFFTVRWLFIWSDGNAG